MFRILAGTFLVAAMTIAMAPASEVKGQITNVKGNTISVTTAPSDGQAGVAKTFTADKEVMIYKLEKKKRVELPDGLKTTELQNIDKKGVTATLIINDDTKKVTEITLGGKKKKN
jgi:hypothetical protein